MDQYRFVGVHADALDGGRPVEPGEMTGEIDVSDKSPKNKSLFDDGLLIKVDAGTYEKSVAEQERVEQERVAQAEKDMKNDTEAQASPSPVAPVSSPPVRSGDEPKDGGS